MWDLKLEVYIFVRVAELGDNPFGVFREVAAHDPVVILGFLLEDVFNALVLVLAEFKHGLALLVVHYLTHEVGVLMMR